MKTYKRLLTTLLLITGCGTSTSGLAIEENEAIIFNRINIEINAPATKVWKANLDRPTYQVLNGRRNQVGEKARFYVPDSQGNPTSFFTNEITCLIDGKLVCHTVKPEINPQNTLVVYTAEVLPQGENKALLQMNIFMRTELGGDKPLSEEELLRLKQEREAQSQVIYEGRFAAFKAQVEADN